MRTILIVEDDEFIRDGLKSMFILEGYRVAECGTVNEAKKLISQTLPDVAVFDVILPDGNGFDLCKEIRKTHVFPVLFLTCRDDEISTVRGFESGGDDYVTKPFRAKELLVRISSLLRRSERVSDMSNQLEFGHIVMDMEKHTVVCLNESIYLTPNEFKVLQVLLRNAEKVVTRQMLLEHIWDLDGLFIDDNTLSVHVSALRRKLGYEGTYIQTVRGVGYTMSKVGKE